jgi:hypothetical protein
MCFFICPPCKIKGAPEDETPACIPHIFAILKNDIFLTPFQKIKNKFILILAVGFAAREL